MRIPGAFGRPRHVVRRLLRAPARRADEHLPMPLETEDRRVLEQIIFPRLLEDQTLQRVLFVGCDFYTHHYPDIFRSREFWTIEPNTRRSAAHGGARRVTDRLERVADHFEQAFFDVVICNGVVGFGLDDRDAAERAFAGCFRVLRPGGLFVHGWNDRADLRPFDLRECRSLEQFTPYVFEPLGATRYLTRTEARHTYDFYAR